MKRTRNILMTEMLASIIISLAIVTLYETEILSPGTLECDTNTEFLTVSIMEIMTICMIPLALRYPSEYSGIRAAKTGQPENGHAMHPTHCQHPVVLYLRI